jgi:hypothetical protein
MFKPSGYRRPLEKNVFRSLFVSNSGSGFLLPMLHFRVSVYLRTCCRLHAHSVPILSFYSVFLQCVCTLCVPTVCDSVRNIHLRHLRLVREGQPLAGWYANWLRARCFLTLQYGNGFKGGRCPQHTCPANWNEELSQSGQSLEEKWWTHSLHHSHARPATLVQGSAGRQAGWLRAWGSEMNGH